MVKGRVSRAVAVLMSIVVWVVMLGGVPEIQVKAAYENTHINTGNQAEDIVAVAETQIGYKEGANNDTKYNRWNGKISGYPVDGYGYPWCQCFVSWCANQAGIPTSIIPRTAGTSTGKSFFTSRGLWQNSAYQGGSYTPKRGDIIYYSDSANVDSPSHVGIVTGCSDGYVYTVEGNYSDSVKRRTIALSNSYIIGYGTPKYANSEPLPVQNPPGWADVSISKQHFKVGEAVQFILTSDTGNSYTVGINDENDDRIFTYNSDVDRSNPTQYFTHIFEKGGNYSCYITAYNDYGLADSGTIYFTIYDESPSYAEISIDKALYKVGEKVEFSMYSDTGNSYTLGINDKNGKRVHTYNSYVDLDTPLQHYSYTFDEVGEYSCYITAYNDCGSVDSYSIDFCIYNSKPSYSKISIEKDRFEIGEVVKFTLESDTGNSYTIGIDDSDCCRIYNYNSVNDYKNTIQYYSHIFDEPGDYSCYVTAYNDYGLSDSERIYFTVYDPNNLSGDLNADTKVTTLDAVMLQKYILNAGTITNWQAGDLNNDGMLDIFDLALLKRMLIENK